MVNDPDSNHLVGWGSQGNSFIIENVLDFSKFILPIYYKHNNFQSFIRQLNKYGFTKIKNSLNNNNNKQKWEFKHENFIRNKPELFMHIKRKTIANKRINILNQDDMNLDLNKVVKKQKLLNEYLNNLQSWLEYQHETINVDFSKIVDIESGNIDYSEFKNNIKAKSTEFNDYKNNTLRAIHELNNEICEVLDDIKTCSSTEVQIRKDDKNFLITDNLDKLEYKMRCSNNFREFPWTYIVPPNILVVDDNSTCRAIYSRALKVFGCDFDIAKNGQEAVNKMKIRKYDMVLMDINMPTLDGLSATIEIRQFDKITPIIAITSNSHLEKKVDMYKSKGINEVLEKPLRVTQLGDIMQNYWVKFRVLNNSKTEQ